MEIPELKEQTGHFGAILCGALVSQRALIDELVANQAFIKKLVVNQAFIKNLVVRKLHIDTIEGDEHNDFEAWFDELNGLKIRNKGEEIFRIDTSGNIHIKGASATLNKLIAPTLEQDPIDAVFGEIWFRKDILNGRTYARRIFYRLDKTLS
ncbi:conserved hypothetical protein [Treponema phagedenis]|uniref:Uncharacterized protein n=1 Tax=Treponema phagedenis TaxID=162 RepID=A0A0B7GUE9_TREPH|nr:hypothetical protein [Treponema phagedenis]CEM60575.1 conserved hypothetical protein [Treponema phagedenis]